VEGSGDRDSGKGLMSSDVGLGGVWGQALPGKGHDLVPMSVVKVSRKCQTGIASPEGLLCRSKNKIVVEYALRNLKRPISVAEWETRIVKALPKEFTGILPTVEEIEAELGGIGQGK
jgi:hypothetical protein